jgi:hypothetical protein
MRVKPMLVGRIDSKTGRGSCLVVVQRPFQCLSVPSEVIRHGCGQGQVIVA